MKWSDTGRCSSLQAKLSLDFIVVAPPRMVFAIRYQIPVYQMRLLLFAQVQTCPCNCSAIECQRRPTRSLFRDGRQCHIQIPILRVWISVFSFHVVTRSFGTGHSMTCIKSPGSVHSPSARAQQSDGIDLREEGTHVEGTQMDTQSNSGNAASYLVNIRTLLRPTQRGDTGLIRRNACNHACIWPHDYASTHHIALGIRLVRFAAST